MRGTEMPVVEPSGSAALEIALAHVLQLGTYASAGLIALGSLVLLAAGHSPVEGGPPLDLADLAADLLALRPEGFLWLGILGILATPALRVIRALMGFARRGEQRMVLVSIGVLVVIAIGVFVGVTAH
ncbi:MAG TPA: DUF1634 domain-containing protein [Candidatus Binatia bacterium]|nr:DUF1634 domain-containing protein [Candidatus Binatia bacterium]